MQYFLIPLFRTCYFVQFGQVLNAAGMTCVMSEAVIRGPSSPSACRKSLQFWSSAWMLPYARRLLLRLVLRPASSTTSNCFQVLLPAATASSCLWVFPTDIVSSPGVWSTSVLNSHTHTNPNEWERMSLWWANYSTWSSNWCSGVYELHPLLYDKKKINNRSAQMLYHLQRQR